MTVLALLWSFIKIGAFTFGGGYAMIPLMQREIIEIHGWLTLKQFLDLIAISQMTPGPLAINGATFIGYRVAGVPGSIAATVGVILPSFVIMIALGLLFSKFQNDPRVQAGSKGIRSAVVALIALVVWSLGLEVIGPPHLVVQVLLAAASFAAAYFYKVHPILILGAAAGLGMLLFR